MSESKPQILIVDDEATIRDSLRLLLKSSYEVLVAEDGEAALSLLTESPADLVILDLVMPKLGGLETLKILHEKSPDLPVIMLTATTTVKTAVEAMKLGAHDYLNKPFDVEELQQVIASSLAISGRHKQQTTTAAALDLPAADFGPMVGRSPAMVDLFQRISQIAERDTTVLITGESGTGKELVARQLHDLSPRRSAPFVALNCAAIPESLIESELFGHERGAFTHAVERRLGHFELADGGTLFLDEIGELSLGVQVKMLRFLQEQEFYRVGRSKPIRVDVRIIAATNRDLEDLIAEKRFRQDLYYRINVINLAMPALRDRYEDIPHLIDLFQRKFSPLYGERTIQFSEEALDQLVQYDWPGNVRELENAVESIFALSRSSKITCEQLPKRIRSGSRSLNLKQEGAIGGMKFGDAERVFETDLILKALKKTNYVQTRAADLLGISRRILKYKMDKLGIPDTPTADTEEPGTPVDAES